MPTTDGSVPAEMPRSLILKSVVSSAARLDRAAYCFQHYVSTHKMLIAFCWRQCKVQVPRKAEQLVSFTSMPGAVLGSVAGGRAVGWGEAEERLLSCSG